MTPGPRTRPWWSSKRRDPSPLFALALVGCSSAWDGILAPCGGASLGWTTGEDPEVRTDLVPPEGCADALVSVLGADPDRLLAQLGYDGSLDEHLELVRTRGRALDGLATVSWGLYWMVGSPSETLGELEADPYIDAAWVTTFGRLAHARRLDEDDPMARVFFEVLADRTASVGWLPEDAPVGAGLAMQGGALGHLRIPRSIDEDDPWAVEPWSPAMVAAALAHEAMHAQLGRRPHTLLCTFGGQTEEEGPYCDADATGAYGAEHAARWSQARRALAGCEVGAEAFAAHAQGNIRAVWESAILDEALPDPVEISCP